MYSNELDCAGSVPAVGFYVWYDLMFGARGSVVG
jgi:hypothetical protein